MAKRWKTYTIRLCPEDPAEAQIIDFLGDRPRSKLLQLWKVVTTPIPERTGTLGSKIEQLRHLIEKTDSDYLLRRMTEEEYAQTLRTISDAISLLERSYVQV